MVAPIQALHTGGKTLLESLLKIGLQFEKTN